MNNRDRQIMRTSVIGIVTNVALAAFKAAAGLIAGSIAIVLDAVNNLSDALSSVITIAGVKLARRKPDSRHPFGYGRIEYLSGIVIALIVLAAGVTSALESIGKIIRPEVPDYSTVTLIIVAAAVITKIILGRYVRAQGTMLKSDALVASGSDALFDAIISTSVLICAVVTIIWDIAVDGWVGAAISVFILKAGVELLLAPLGQMIGVRVDSELSRGIKADIKAYDGVLGAYDLVIHNYGPDYAMGSVHVEVDDSMSARDLHLLFKRIQMDIVQKYSTFLTVGLYAVDSRDDETGRMQKHVREIAKGFEGIRGAHGVFIDSARMTMTFDVVMDFKVPDRDELRSRIADAVTAAYPGYTVDISIDTDYSD